MTLGYLRNVFVIILEFQGHMLRPGLRQQQNEFELYSAFLAVGFQSLLNRNHKFNVKLIKILYIVYGPNYGMILDKFW